MDPDTALHDLRRLVAGALTGDPVDAAELAQAFDVLDAWVTRGGFLPAPWRSGR